MGTSEQDRIPPTASEGKDLYRVRALLDGARFCLKPLYEFKGHGPRDCPVMMAHGPNGFPQAMQAVLPQTIVQTCIGHLRRCGLSPCQNGNRKEMAWGVQAVCRANSLAAAENRQGIRGVPA